MLTCSPQEKIIVEFIQGVTGCYMHFYKSFELKCVLTVCVHNHPIMIQIHPVFLFFNLLKSLPLSQIEPSVRVTSHGWRPRPRVLIDRCVSAQTALVSFLRPVLSEPSSVVSPPEQMKNDSREIEVFCMNIAVISNTSSSILQILSIDIQSSKYCLGPLYTKNNLV